MAGSATSEDGDIGFQIAPMVDVVFVLMLFFMAMASAQVKEKELHLALPGIVNGHHTGPVNAVVIAITEEGQVSVNDQIYATPSDRNLSRLREWLKAGIEQFGDGDPIFIRPQPGARHERIIEVLNAAAYAGVKKLTFS